MTWRALSEELNLWRECGRTATFWWRDDDASAPAAALARLLALSQTSGVPLALAVIALSAVPTLFEGLRASVLMHGTDHVNRAAAGEKKTEFPVAERDEDALARLAAGRRKLEQLAGTRFLPVLAPPWNRFKDSLLPGLSGVGLHAISRYGASSGGAVREVNTHLDIIDWHGSRGFIGEEIVLRAAIGHLATQRSKPLHAMEATGLLTHHAVHDGAAWDFIEGLFERTRALGARWAEPTALFPSR